MEAAEVASLALSSRGRLALGNEVLLGNGVGALFLGLPNRQEGGQLRKEYT